MVCTGRQANLFSFKIPFWWFFASCVLKISFSRMKSLSLNSRKSWMSPYQTFTDFDSPSSFSWFPVVENSILNQNYCQLRSLAGQINANPNPNYNTFVSSLRDFDLLKISSHKHIKIRFENELSSSADCFSFFF